MLNDSTTSVPDLSEDDWVSLKELLPLLEVFKELTLRFSETTSLRLSECALEFEDMFVTLNGKFIADTSCSDILKAATNAALAKLAKYFSKISTPTYALSITLDPRFKLDVFQQTQDPQRLTTYATNQIEGLFLQYQAETEVLEGEQNITVPVKKKSRFVKVKLSFMKEITKRSELEIYLTEDLEGGDDFNLNAYWLANKKRFPTLFKIARDVLVCQATTKDVEGAFSKGRRTIPYYRRRQTGQTIRNQMLVNASINLFPKNFKKVLQ